MNEQSTNAAPSPFHPGEAMVQERVGVRERMEMVGKRSIRDYMPDQHRDFFEMLPFILVGSVDESGQPWASILTGHPNFITSPDPKRLQIKATPLFGDPLENTLGEGTPLGFLGIQLETRRRNRMNGIARSYSTEGFDVEVVHSFGNCPQYIQTRGVEVLPEVDEPRNEKPVENMEAFDERTKALISNADTIFIATTHSEDGDETTRSVDVSHRGGKPGFLRIDDDRSFTLPDFAGNLFFNTMGNITLNPRAGFLIPDFTTGDVLYLGGTAEIIWDEEKIQAFPGAERLLHFTAEKIIRVEKSLPLRFIFGEYSPKLEALSGWA